MTDRVIHTGPSVSVFTNGGVRVQWQLIASLDHTCGVCLSYHTAVSPQPWPIPIHHGCRCDQVPILSGEDAHSSLVIGHWSLVGSVVLQRLPAASQAFGLGRSSQAWSVRDS
jgi:hypothetical protein